MKSIAGHQIWNSWHAELIFPELCEDLNRDIAIETVPICMVHWVDRASSARAAHHLRSLWCTLSRTEPGDVEPRDKCAHLETLLVSCHRGKGECIAKGTRSIRDPFLGITAEPGHIEQKVMSTLRIRNGRCHQSATAQGRYSRFVTINSRCSDLRHV